MDLLVPPDSNYMSRFLDFCIRLKSTAHTSDFSANLSARIALKQLSEALTITEVPHACRAITTCCDQTSLSLIEAACRDFGFLKSLSLRKKAYAMSITELRHQLSSFNVPDRNETSIVSGHHSLKFCVIERERDRVLVAGLDLFLSLEEP
jgi:hypothetical protein